jgi:hypothetical protein
MLNCPSNLLIFYDVDFWYGKVASPIGLSFLHYSLTFLIHSSVYPFCLNVSLKREISPFAFFCFTLLAGYLLGLLVDPEDEDSTFLRKVGGILTHYMTLHPRRQYSSQSLRREPQIQLFISFVSYCVLLYAPVKQACTC